MYTNNPIEIVKRKKLNDMQSNKKFIFILVLKLINIHLQTIILYTFCSKKIFLKKNNDDSHNKNKLKKFKKKTPYKPK